MVALWMGCRGFLATTGTEDGPNPDPTTDVAGVPVWHRDFAPLDGIRRWNYAAVDGAVPYLLIGSNRATDTIPADGVYTLDFDTDCIDDTVICVGSERIRSYDISNTEEGGLLVHHWQAGSFSETYDPPLQLAAPNMAVGDEILEIVNGDTWTTSLVATMDCGEVSSLGGGITCVHLRAENSSGGGLAMAGEWYFAEGVGLARHDLDYETGTVWELDTSICLAGCDGVW